MNGIFNHHKQKKHQSATEMLNNGKAYQISTLSHKLSNAIHLQNKPMKNVSFDQ